MQQIPVDQLQAARPQLGEAPVLLDVREDWEVQLAPLAVEGFTTVHIPMGRITARAEELPEDSSIVCVCHHGVRSLQVAHYLERLGRVSVFNLQGGIDAWSVRMDPAVPRY